MQYSVIYKFTSIDTKKVYIGYTTQNVKQRYNQHYSNAFNKKIKSKFYNAIRKYGWDNFIREIIYTGFDSDHTLNEMEPHFISEYNSYKNGYNSTVGGNAPMRHKSHTIKSKQKMSVQRSGPNHHNYGKQHTTNTKVKMSESAKKRDIHGMSGKTHSTESKKKMSRAKKNKGISNKNNNAQHYTFTSPNNISYDVIGQLDEFLAEHGMSRDMVYKYRNTGEIPYSNKKHFPKRYAMNGWTIVHHSK